MLVAFSFQPRHVLSKLVFIFASKLETMSKRESFARYNLIISKLEQKPSTFKEINDYLKSQVDYVGEDLSISKRTFDRDRAEIESLFGTVITFDFSNQKYFIESKDDTETSNRILEAFDTFNVLKISDRLSNYVHFESRKPMGTTHLYGLLHAVKNGLVINFTYQKHWEDISTMRHVEPYALKEFNHRWYIVAKDLKDNKIKIFGLDRLLELDITKKRFVMPVDFSVNDFFRHVFGIIVPNGDTPEEVVLSLTKIQGNYVKSLPLHESQEIISESDDEVCIKLKVYITLDFEKELMSIGENVTVIQPQRLRDSLKMKAESILKKYQTTS